MSEAIHKAMRIIWIEDDYYAIKGLVRPLEKSEKITFKIDVATSALEGFQKLGSSQAYDLIVVDLILPLFDQPGNLPAEVASWKEQKYVGIGLIRWLMSDVRPGCPVLILSVVEDPIQAFGLQDLGLVGSLPKRGLLPSVVKEHVFNILKLEG
jgi:DNA-binding NarL/FixJ family response regulator